MFTEVVDAIQREGGKLVELNWAPFDAANELLYNSTFVLERLTMLPDGWLEKNKQLLHPVTRQVFESMVERQSTSTAVDVFKDLQKQAECKRAVEKILTLEENIEDGIDEMTLMIVPTAPLHPTLEEVGRDPVAINERLGAFAHFANVLDLVGVAVPCGVYENGEVDDGRKVELPFGVTILAGAGLDAQVVEVVRRWEERLGDLYW
jgi:Asp-tRNA(Asn)/Glu-tRNA(Gln) amidotransferase A subunit family amidase